MRKASKTLKKLREKKIDKIKVLTISDHPYAPSGVGTQTKYFCEALLDSGQFEVISLAGAPKHSDYNVQRSPDYEDWTIVPVDGYGSQDQIRYVLNEHKPDILWFMTDPRYYDWLWTMENEIRAHIPMVYYHVWDNYPVPDYNKVWYDSTDAIVSISKLTKDIVDTLADEKVDSHYIPHAVPPDIFRKMPQTEVDEMMKDLPQDILKDRFVFFWNSRNARRKQSGSLIFWFKEFLDDVGHDKASLIMHTDPFDQHGQNLAAILEKLEMTNGEVIFSQQKLPTEFMAAFYNYADCTVNVSDAEGFGLSCLESLACGTPAIVTATGGLQDQIYNDEGEELGVALEPASKAVIGSQQIPYIYEDRLAKEDVVAAMKKMYNMSKEEREKLGQMALDHVDKNFNFKDYGDQWVKIMKDINNKYSSWPNKQYDRWNLIEA